MRKGIILAGGNGTRLYPATRSVSKQLLPIYDKPLIYYPLTTLLLAGITEIAVITKGEDSALFQRLLGNGERFGAKLTYLIQDSPDGLPNAYLIAEKFLDGGPSLMILGDNIFHGPGLGRALRMTIESRQGASIFVTPVPDPTRFGILSRNGNYFEIQEKPSAPRSNLAITGMYALDESASTRARSLHKSSRGETEIVDLLQTYLDESQLHVVELARGSIWLDAGTPRGLSEAAEFVRVTQERQAVKIGCPEEAGLNMGFVSIADLTRFLDSMPDCEYRTYLARLLEQATETQEIDAGVRD